MSVFVVIAGEHLVREMISSFKYQPQVGDTFQFDDGHGIRKVVVTARSWRLEDYPGPDMELVLHVEPVV